MRMLRHVAVRCWLPLLLLLVWGAVVARWPNPFFPRLEVIADRFADNWLFARFGRDIVPSMVSFLSGYLAALAVGLSLGFILGLVPRLERIVDPAIQFMRALPSIAVVPVILVMFGLGLQSKIVIIMFGSIWPILLNTIDGIRGLEPELKRVSQVYRLPMRIYLLRVLLPAALPQILAGARISLAIALVLMVGSELYASSRGIGYFVLQAQQSFAIPDMWSGIVLLGILGYLLTFAFSMLERKVLFWNRP